MAMQGVKVSGMRTGITVSLLLVPTAAMCACSSSGGTVSDLIKEGDSRACVQPAVRTPLAKALDSSASNLSFTDTAMDAYSRESSRMTCLGRVASTAVPDRTIAISYTIRPSLDNPTVAVVTVRQTDKQAIAELLSDSARKSNGVPVVVASHPAAPAFADRDVAGGYVADDGSRKPACETDNNYVFAPDHSYVGFLDRGRWTLTGVSLRVRGKHPKGDDEDGPLVPFRYNWRVLSTNRRGMRIIVDDGSTLRLYRCPTT